MAGARGSTGPDGARVGPRTARASAPDPATRATDTRATQSVIPVPASFARTEEHTSELHSLTNLECRLLLAKKKPGLRPPDPDNTRYLSKPSQSPHPHP